MSINDVVLLVGKSIGYVLVVLVSIVGFRLLFYFLAVPRSSDAVSNISSS